MFYAWLCCSCYSVTAVPAIQNLDFCYGVNFSSPHTENVLLLGNISNHSWRSWTPLGILKATFWVQQRPHYGTHPLYLRYRNGNSKGHEMAHCQSRSNFEWTQDIFEAIGFAFLSWIVWAFSLVSGESKSPWNTKERWKKNVRQPKIYMVEWQFAACSPENVLSVWSNSTFK